MKIITILGARPQFIKAGSVSREIAKHDDIEEVIVHTGQHFDENMSAIFFEQMKIPKPDYNLDINGLGHGAMTGQMLEKIEEVLLKEKPDWVLVYGDTNSTLAGSLSASKLHIKVAHVEAGLRSFNMNMPEEINRIVTDRISTILFCPTETAVQNLEKEGYKSLDIEIIKNGDVMQDGAIFYKDLAVKPNCKIEKSYVLSTIHRAENTDDLMRLTSIIKALNEISEEKQVILPLHPRTKAILEKNNMEVNFTIIEPVGYLEMVYLIKNSSMVMTDSGGLQKEAFFFEKPCITLRDETEWIELIENRFNVLAGADEKNILNLYQKFEFNNDFSIDLYGAGQASKKIIHELLRGEKMNEKNNLEFCFKGNRTYVQGPDIFDATLVKIYAKYKQNMITDIKYSAHAMLLTNADILFVEDFNKDDFEKINSIITFKVENKKISAVIVANNTRIECSSEYSEEIVRTNALITDKVITFQNTLPDSLTEIVVSMNKYFFQETVTKEGKWIVTKFEYNNLKDIEDIKNKKLKLELMNNFNNKLTKSKIIVDNIVVGYLYFSLI